MVTSRTPNIQNQLLGDIDRFCAPMEMLVYSFEVIQFKVTCMFWGQ